MVQVLPLAGPWISKWCGGAIQAVFATVMVHALVAVPAALVQRNVPAAATLALIPRVAVPELPEAQVRLMFCRGSSGRILTLGGVRVTLVTPAPVTVTCAVSGVSKAGVDVDRMMLAAGHGVVAEVHASRVTGSAHSVAAPSWRIS